MYFLRNKYFFQEHCKISLSYIEDLKFQNASTKNSQRAVTFDIFIFFHSVKCSCQLVVHNSLVRPISYEHQGRCQNQDKRLWGSAKDHVLSRFLVISLPRFFCPYLEKKIKQVKTSGISFWGSVFHRKDSVFLKHPCKITLHTAK